MSIGPFFTLTYGTQLFQLRAYTLPEIAHYLTWAHDRAEANGG